MTLRRSTLLALVLAVALPLAALLCAAPPRGREVPPPAQETSVAKTPPADWRRVDQLISEQKLAEALAATTALREAAQAAGRTADWTQGLIREMELRGALGELETAVETLKKSPWPADDVSQATLSLHYGQALVEYLQAYSWEIQQRERVATSEALDLKAWSKDQLAAEAVAAYLAAWQHRTTLGERAAGDLPGLVRNAYPPGIRDTLRDSLSYLFVELLADRALWRPEQDAEIWRLSLPELLGGRSEGVELADPATHPLAKLAAVLGDLERWHARAGGAGAALEAFLARARALHDAFAQAADRRTIRRAVERALTARRADPWWAEGMATLADFVLAENEPGARARARALAAAGAKAYPRASGGAHCAHLVARIEAPQVSLEAMASDGPGRRSLRLQHRNLANVWLRAYAVDLLSRIEHVVEQNPWPSGREVEKLVAAGRPVAEWEVALPATPDYEVHSTYSVPPLTRAGAYLVVASARRDFALAHNHLEAAGLLVSDLVLVNERLAGRRLELRALAGASGEPAAGAEVTAYRYEWRQPAQVVGRGRADADGRVTFELGGDEGWAQHFVVGRWNGELAMALQWRSHYAEAESVNVKTALLFTDRSLYRPRQKVLWKALVYAGEPRKGKMRLLPSEPLTVSLVDANGETVAETTVASNGFGSASGELTIPGGKLLGNWTLHTSLGGDAGIGVEEYKRPTFTVELLDPESPLRLNREARLRGDAKYYFGLPLSAGQVAFRVTRAPLYPWWYWAPWRRPQGEQMVASGTAALDEQGRFAFAFTPAADEREAGSGVTYNYRVAVEATDEGGETRTAERGFRLGWVAVEARLEGDEGFATAGQPATRRVVRTDLDGAPRAGDGSWRLTALAQPATTLLQADLPADVAAGDGGEIGAALGEPAGTPSVTAGDVEAVGMALVVTPGDRLRPRWEGAEPALRRLRRWRDGEEVGRGTLHHDAQGRATIALPALVAGAYRLRYETRDEAGALFSTQEELVVAGAGLHLAVPALLLAERPRVEVGERARFLVGSGLAGQAIYLDLFRDGKAYRRERLTAERSGVLELPVGEADRGGFVARATVLRDHQLATVDVGVDVPWTDRRLQLELSTFRDRLAPGSKETWRVTVKDAGGRPVEAGAAELLAAMYDQSLDAFRPHYPPDPFGLYPSRASAPSIDATLGLALHPWGNEDDWYELPDPPALAEDRLEQICGYGIGGPGMRFRGGVMAMRKMAMPASVAEAPAPQEADARGVEGGVPGGVAGGVMGGIASVASIAVPPPPPPPPTLRADFSETALWRPHLLTGVDGSVAIEIEMPDSVTAWRFWLRAVTRDLAAGAAEREVRTVRDLMVRPYLPRFLREGDEARLKIVVNDAAERPLDGEVVLSIFDPETHEDLGALFGLTPGTARQRFHVAAGGGTNLTVPLVAPRRVGPVAFKVVATAGGLSDGELRPLPLLPSRVHLVQSRFVALHDRERRELDFADLRAADPTRIDEQLVVTVDGQLFYGMLAALPYLVQYPYECTEQTLERFLATGIVGSLFDRYPAVAKMAAQLAARDTPFEPWDAGDPNRKLALEETPWLALSRGGEKGDLDWVKVLDPKLAQATREEALSRLAKAQLPSGAFPWFAGGPPSPYITLYLMYGFAKAAEFGVEVPRDMVTRAWQYLARDFREHWLRDLRKHDCCWEYLTLLNYVVSAYPDPSWTAEALTAAERREILDHSFAHWRDHAPMLKLMLAMTLHRMDRAKDAQLVLASVMDSAQTTRDEGTFWQPEDRAWLWYNDTIETHAWALRALLEVAPQDERRHGLVQWLFLQKKLGHWHSTRATAEVLYSLASYLKREGTLAVREAVRVEAGRQTAEFVFEPDRFTGKANRLIVPGDKLDTTAVPTVVVEKETPGLAFASATWHFSTEQPPKEARGDLFAVERRFFKRVKQGREVTLEPLAAGAALAPGDEVEVQLALRSKVPAEYVHLRDPRPAGLEPDRSESGWRWDLGIVWYEETRDSGANFFFEALPAGEYTFKYRVRANLAGTFKAGPATVQSMYAPEFVAYSAGDTVRIGESQPGAGGQ